MTWLSLLNFGGYNMVMDDGSTNMVNNTQHRYSHEKAGPAAQSVSKERLGGEAPPYFG